MKFRSDGNYWHTALWNRLGAPLMRLNDWPPLAPHAWIAACCRMHTHTGVAL